MYNTVTELLSDSANVDTPYVKVSECDRKAVLVITSNRGLAGGYNSNIVKLITNGDFDKDKTDIYIIGRKGRELLERKGYYIRKDYSELAEGFEYADAIKVCNKLLKEFDEKKIGEIYLAYTNFKNTVSHEPTLLKLLPIIPGEIYGSDEEDDPNDKLLLMNFEIPDDEALKYIVPKYLTSLIHGALIEAVASENGARMQAMDNATNNAEEMIDKLTLQYNRARQGSITQELTEIIAGAEAIS
jgi:F-type H+-transporting ATPase subunit gamma